MPAVEKEQQRQTATEQLKHESPHGSITSDILDEFSIRDCKKASIRRFKPDDQPAIRQICCETGFFGRPIDTFFKDRQLFADLFTRPYLDYESEWALVAEVDGEISGYLLGSVRNDFDWILMRTNFRTVCRMLFRLAAARYRNTRSGHFIRWLITSGLRERPKRPADAAHLHVNLTQSCRGYGVGRRLWETYEEMLRVAAVKSCYGEFFSYPGHRPENAYARYNFTVFDRRETTLFQSEIRDKVDTVCVQKWL